MKRPIQRQQGHPSRRGIWMRALIAAVIRAAGDDIVAIGKKHSRKVQPSWRPPHGFQLEKVSLPEQANAEYLIPRKCIRKDIVLLQLHGGAYTIGYLPLFRRRAAKLARLGGLIPVLSLDYRIAPEHPYPAALDDAVHAIDWLRKEKGIKPESVIVVGESAGAGLGLALAMRLRDEGAGHLKAMVLMSPWTDLTCQGRSYTERYHMDPLFGRRTPSPDNANRLARGETYAQGHDLRDPYLSPAFGDFTAMPPMLVHVGEYEMLYDDAAIISEKARAAGISVEFKVWPGMFHAFQLADAWIPEAKAAMQEIGTFIQLQTKI